jgi:hypothetical protein
MNCYQSVFTGAFAGLLTWFAALLLFVTSAHAAPLYLSCEGEGYISRDYSNREPARISITIDGRSVKVEDLAPAEIYSDDGDVWTFGEAGAALGHVSWGQINRITGHAQVTIKLSESLNSYFDGLCHKTEKRF